MTGTGRKVKRTVRVAHPIHPDAPARRFQLAADEVLKLNPNSGTLPMFRTQVDADITLGIYGRHPVLIRDDDLRRQPLGLSFGTLFHMANDSGLFHQPEDFAHDECNGWSYEHDGKECLTDPDRSRPPSRVVAKYLCCDGTYTGSNFDMSQDPLTFDTVSRFPLLADRWKRLRFRRLPRLAK